MVVGCAHDNTADIWRIPNVLGTPFFVLLRGEVSRNLYDFFYLVIPGHKRHHHRLRTVGLYVRPHGSLVLRPEKSMCVLFEDQPFPPHFKMGCYHTSPSQLRPIRDRSPSALPTKFSGPCVKKELYGHSSLKKSKFFIPLNVHGSNTHS